MKGIREKYIDHVYRVLFGFSKDVKFYLLLPDSKYNLEQTLVKFKVYVEELINQIKSDD